MGQDDYAEVVSGSGGLKLKGIGLPQKKKKKKSSSSSSNKDRLKSDNLNPPSTSTLTSTSTSTSTSTLNNPTLNQLESLGNVTRVEKTLAERRFEAVQKKRLAEKAKKQALKTHKDRVADFNERLEAQSEHFDIPKVGPG
ncbi:uncharacterized protein MELLADRAFT_84737 [Melampsora larici-populina 98AG31]|uniref:DUF1754-domain-containing protein n=1 Tax=Melampsora larici-populina (strain 98AG31 / pathotype 3-4-7) TaxID=747676 RepID=F4RG36_MELLP|nr:uncharacterized protein MELLADRAFT_84737 [Melampsora larici-populina 98AG31]EGG08539.1 hypothetical protein MELLADRAFT_84737 [Melampsora larici-populina 98AG31]